MILDDMEVRHEGFKRRFIGCEITHCYTYDEAVAALTNDIFDLVCLDHDLTELQTCGYDDGEKCGYDVALFLAALEKNKLPKEVLVHSWNIGGARRIVAALAGKGMLIYKQPYCEG